jgi:predicted metal-binding membrane protein
MIPNVNISVAGKSTGIISLVLQHAGRTLGILTSAGIAWVFLIWISLDTDHVFPQLTMPSSAAWSAGNVLAVWLMWAIMMAAMMLPSALPMILTFVDLSKRSGEPVRGRAFISAYLAIWFGFSSVAMVAQWALQAVGWLNPMITSTSSTFTGSLLLAAGIYQLSPLKRLCLVNCRTPLGFLLGEWRSGAAGAFLMGARHGLFCVGCCWALMALLFVGGVMNLAWVAALSIAVAIEKLLPGGERLSVFSGLALIVAGFVRLLPVGTGA